MGRPKRVALLRGGAWIEMLCLECLRPLSMVALLRGGAWIEIIHARISLNLMVVALLRGGAWIEISTRPNGSPTLSSRTPSRGCVD